MPPTRRRSTSGGSYIVNLAFHCDVFPLAVRPLTTGTADLSLRLKVSGQYKQTVWEFDVLRDVKLVRPDLAVRITG